MMHWPTSWAYVMLGTVEICSKTAHPRELNKHILKSEWNKREELDGQEKEKEKEKEERRVVNMAWGT